MTYEANIFTNRADEFRFGYAAFFDGRLDNFYSDTNISDDEWFKNREWQHGFDVAYLEAQAYWDSRNARV